MTTFQFAIIIALVLAVAVIASYIGYLIYQLKSRELQRRDMDFYSIRERSEREFYLLERRFEEMVSVSRKATESALEDIQSRVLSAMEINRAELNRALRERTALPTEQTTKFSNRPGLLIREISHALNTPLSQMEAALLTVKTELRHPDPQNISARLRSIQIGLDICKSVVGSFRELILGSKASSAWAPQSLKEAIATAAEAYIAQHGTKIFLNNELPDNVRGYSNNYLISLLLPLVENAIDSATPDTTVSLSISNVDGFDRLSISNKPLKLPISHEIYDDGFSTKPGHTGTGLTIVQHLLTAMPSASLSHKIVEDVLTFDIMIEARS